MKYKEAQELKKGDAVKAPKVGLHCGYVEKVEEVDDPMVRLLVHVETPPLSEVKAISYRLVEMHNA
jgi:hypothetical protein